jgi:hypothetical protein
MRFAVTAFAALTLIVSTAGADETSDSHALLSGDVTVVDGSANGVTARFRHPRSWRLVPNPNSSAGLARYGDLHMEGAPQCGLSISPMDAPLTAAELEAAWVSSIRRDPSAEIALTNRVIINGMEGIEVFYNERTSDPFAPRAKHLAFAVARGAAIVQLDCSIGDLAAERQAHLFGRYTPVFRLIAQTLSAER